MKKPLKLNLGAGENRIEGYISIDNEKSTKPDLLHDFIKQPLPYKSKTVDEVIFFHCIEHISKRFHKLILHEVQRVLKPGGVLLVSYPEFAVCVQHWLDNYRGMRKFWEATVYGRQLFPSDFHVCAMDTLEFTLFLKECGFNDIRATTEATEKHNTVIRAVAGTRFKNYEQLCKEGQETTRVVKTKRIRS